MRKALLILSAVFGSAATYAQIGTLCDNAAPICAQTGLTFTNSTGVPSLGTVNCLYTTPNPTMYYMQLDNAGSLDFSLTQTNTGGSGIDVDFMLWGPFTSQAAGCASIASNMSQSNADCSYSATSNESVNIVNGPSGGYYILLITNYSNQAGTINFVQTGGTGTTNCGLLSNAQNNGPVCEGEVVELTGDEGPTGSTYTYNWYLMPDFSTPVSTANNFTYTPPGPGNYEFAYVIMNTVTFEADTAYTTAVVNPIPAPPVFTISSPTCQGATVTLTPTPQIQGGTYAWTGSNGYVSNQPVATFANANPAFHNGTYTLKVTVDGCTSDPFSLPLNITPAETPVISGPNEVCEGQTVELSVTNASSFTSFKWNGVTGSSTQLVGPGTYTVVTTDVNNCQGTSLPHAVSVISNPLDITGPDHFCEGNPVSLSATPGKQSYSWTTGSNSETTQVDEDGLVIVTVVSQEGCERSDSLLVMMYDKPEVDFSPSMSCDSIVTFQNNSEVSDNYGSALQNYSWNFGHINPDSTQAVSAVENPVHAFPAPGTYTVSLAVESNHGCTNQKQVQFEVVKKPAVDFVFESLCFAEGKFTNLTQAGSKPIETMEWSFGDNSANSDTKDTVFYHSYPSISTYDVSLTVTDVLGCVSNKVTQIVLKDTPVFEDIPNIITPNGDNVNDSYSFMPILQDCFNYTFTVFNRWGAIVFETEKSEKGFGGISNLGSKLQDGVYFWVLMANGVGAGQGEQVVKKGTITIAASGTK